MKQIIKKFNNLVKETIFKVQNKTNNNFNISGFNRYLITLVTALFIYLFYLLVPLMYNKTWVQNKIESKLLDEFKVNLSTSADISYRILPSPHFLIKDSKISVNDGKKNKTIAEVKKFKVFLSQLNFLNKEKINFKKVVINNANFSLLGNELKLLSKLKTKEFPKKKIKVNNSNIFFKDNLGDVISIIKIDKTILFFDNKKLLNFLDVNGEVFNAPFNFNFQHKNNPIKFEAFNFYSKFLRLNIFNESTVGEDSLTIGKNVISILNSRINTKYNVKEKLIIFKSDKSRINNSQISYSGELSINPFDLDLNINLNNSKISKLSNINPTLIEFIKSGLLFNRNISADISMVIKSNVKNEIFNNAKIKLSILNGRINFDNTIFSNDSIGSLKLSNSNLFFENNNLTLNTDILFEAKSIDGLFTLLNTNKKSRKKFQNILINLDYNLLGDEIRFNQIKIDNKEASDQFLDIIDEFNENDFNNFVSTRRLINKLFSVYEG